MRPSDITDGIGHRALSAKTSVALGFNEAVGYYRRNRGELWRRAGGACASMRPSDITDGIRNSPWYSALNPSRFNEAVGYYRRNPESDPNSSPHTETLQ